MADDESEGSLVEAEAEGGDEDEDEFREVDPMQVIEDRLLLLEAWLHEDPGQEDVNQKREEYLSLMEELEILGKKMRKTDKLLAVPNQPNQAKLERKRDQYEREVTDIVLYGEQDSFFDLEGENGEAALNAYMNANSLLGKPLETLAEMSGFEDSKAWNESFGTLAGSTREERSESNSNSKRTSVAHLDMTKSHNQTIIKKKMKKAKQLLGNATTEDERRKLLKKIEEYKVALDAVSAVKDESSDEEGENSRASDESIETPMHSPIKLLSPKKIKKPKKDEEEGDPEYILMKKKLAKAKKMLQKATTSNDLHKFQKKIDEYLAALAKFPGWKQDQLAYGYSAGQSVDEDEDETTEWLEQQAAADEERLAREDEQELANQQRRYQAKSMLGARSKTEKKDKKQEKRMSASSGLASGDESLDLETYIDEERKQNKILRKKLKKVETTIDDKLEREGDEARYTKEFKKLLKKKKQYLHQLGEDHASLANLSLSGSSMDMSFNMSSSHGGDVEISMMDMGFDDYEVVELDEDRQYREAKEAKERERQRQREERLAAKAADENDDEDEDVILVRKKLKKLEKMLRTVESGSKDEEKLLKKKWQYLAELGEAELGKA